MEIDDSQNVQACQEGNHEGFGKLYDKYVEKIYNFVYYRIQHKETAEDLSSLIFTKALEKINSFNASKASFSTWLYRIARNSVIDYYRTNKPTDDIEAGYEISFKQNIEAEIDAKAQLEKVKKYLNTLPERQRDIILMRVWDGLSHQKISEILEISEGNCKMTFCRAMEKLRTELGTALILYLLLITKM